MARHWKIALALLGVSVVAGLLTFPAALRTVMRLRRSAAAEEQARRDIVQPPISTPTDTREKAQLFWASATSLGTLEPMEVVELSLSADPVQRAKQVIAALISRAPTPEQRTVPAEAVLLQFYLLPDGTAIADFSEALGAATPSGILSEEMTVDSIARSLGANVSAVHRLKILIHGQETETLAGHLDLTGFFPVAPAEPAASPDAPSSPAAATPAVSAAPSAAPPATP